MWLFGLFLAVPLIEIGLFIQVGGLIGLWPTLGLVLLTAVTGTALMRSQGSRAWIEIQRSVNELRDPSQPIAHGAMVLLAGLLLLTPGFFTDTLGILLLIPSVRVWALRQLSKRVQFTRVGMGPQPGARPHEAHRPPYGDGVIDAEYVTEPDEAQGADSSASTAASSGSRRPSGWTRQ